MAVRAWMKWIASKARSFRDPQRPFLLPRWLRWIGWFAVAGVFYGVFTEVGLRHVYRRYNLSDAELLHPPSATWIGSPADEFGVLSHFRAPTDQISGLLVAVAISGTLACSIYLRRSLVSIGILAIVVLVLPELAWVLAGLIGYHFYDVSIYDGLSDPSLDPEVFWIGGTLEEWSAVELPKLTCRFIVAGVALTEIYRRWRDRG